MDIKQLQYFLAVCELKSITRASERMNLTQPALGQQIRNLEDRFGFDLLVRHSRGVQLTDAGERLRSHAEDLLSRVAIIESDMQRYSDRAIGTVSVGVTPSVGRWLVLALLEACSDRHAELELKFTQGFTDQLDDLIDSGKIDVSLTHTEMDNERKETIPLLVERMEVIGSPLLLEGLSSPVSLKSLAKIPVVFDERSRVVRQIVDEALQEENTELQDTISIHAINIRRELVLKGKRCSIAPPALFEEEIRADELEALEIDHPRFERTLHLATPRVETMTPAVQAVRTLIIELVDSMISKGRKGWKMP